MDVERNESRSTKQQSLAVSSEGLCISDSAVDQAHARPVGLELPDNFTIRTIHQATDDLRVETLGQEPHTAITQQSVAATRVEAERLIVRAAVVGRPRAFCRSCGALPVPLSV